MSSVPPLKTRVRSILLAGLASGLLLAGCDIVGGSGGGDGTVEVNSAIQSDRTWTPDESYLVTSDLCVANSATLTIEAGTQIEFEADTGLRVCSDDAALIATGAADNPVRLTGTQSEPDGWWKGIFINSSNSQNELRHVEIENAGSNNFPGTGGTAAAVALIGEAQLTLTDATITGSGGYGMYVKKSGGSVDFANNTFSGNQEAPVSIPFPLIGIVDSGSRFDGDTFVYVRPGFGNNLKRDATVDALADDVSYRIDGEAKVQDGATLTISAGVEMTFTANAGLKATDNNASTAIAAEGSANNRIRMTATPGNEEPGWWKGVGIRSANSNNTLEYVIVRHAGSEQFGGAIGAAANVGLDGDAALTLTNAELTDGASHGVHCGGGEATLDASGNTFQNIAGENVHGCSQ